jgi:iron complex outermembrane recepter protein
LRRATFAKIFEVKKLSAIFYLLLTITVEAQFDSTKNLDPVKVQTKQTINVGKAGIAPMDLPQATSVVTERILRDQQVQKLSDVLKNVNGIYLSSTRGSTQENFSARGYTLGSGNLFKDGVRINSGTIPEMSGLEKVEMLKGATAILFGNVTPGGILNLITKRPKFQQGGEIAVRVGSYGLFKPSFDVYGPFSNNVAYRINGSFETAASYRDQVQSKRYYVNPSLLFKLNDRTDLIIQGDMLYHEFTPDFGIGSIDNTKISPVGRNVFFGASWQYVKTNQRSATATLNHNLNSTWKLNASASYQHYDRDYFSIERMQAFANGDLPRPLGRTFNSEDYYTVQTNVTGRWKQHQLLAGFDADTYQTLAFAYNQQATYDTINIFDPNKFTAKTAMPDVKQIRKVLTPVYRFGAYVQDLIHVNEKLKLLVGLRWTIQESKPADTTELPSNAKKIGVVKTDRAFSPRVGMVYKPTNFTSVFISYANSFNPNNGLDIYGSTLPPSIIDQYELGVKNELFRGKLSVNVTGYRIINNNLAQTALFDKSGAANSNTNLKSLNGQTTSDGVELDIVAHPWKGADINAGYSYNYIRYTKTPDTKGSFVEGERLQNSVGSTANLSVFSNYKKFRFGATSFYTGKRTAGFNNTKLQSQTYNRLFQTDGFVTIDVSAAYQAKKFSVTAKVSNITNTLNYILHENYSINPIPPRQLMATIAYKL